MGEAPSSFDNFRRRVGSRTPPFGIALFLHVALGFALAVVLWGRDRDRYGYDHERNPVELLVANTTFGRTLIVVGGLTLAITAALGVRFLRRSHAPRAGWPLFVPGLILGAGMLAPFSWAAGVVGGFDAGARAAAPSLTFSLTGLALGAGAAIARPGFAFAATSLSLAAWAFALSAARESRGTAPRFALVPAILVLVGTGAGAALSGSAFVWLAVALGLLGVVTFFSTRSAPAGAESTRDVIGAGLSVSAALVLGSLFHFCDHVVDAASMSETVRAIQTLARAIALADHALWSGLAIAVGAFLATLVAVAGRRDGLRPALRGALWVALGTGCAALVPLGEVRYRVHTSVKSLVASTRFVLPSDVQLPRAPAEFIGDGLMGQSLCIGSSSTSVAVNRPAKPTAEYIEPAACEKFAVDVLTAPELPSVQAAVDRRVPYGIVACIAIALVEQARTKHEYTPRLVFLGESQGGRLPGPFEHVTLPPEAWSVAVERRVEGVSRQLYADKTGGWHVGGNTRPVALDAALKALEDFRADLGYLAVTAHPETPWETVFEAIVRLSRQGTVVLGAPRDMPWATGEKRESEEKRAADAALLQEMLGEGPSSKVESKLTIVVAAKGPLSSDELRRAVEKRSKKLRACHEAALKKTPALSGRVRLGLIAETDGKLSNLENAGSTIGDPSVIECAIAALQDIQLSPAEETTKFKLKLELAPVEAPEDQ